MATKAEIFSPENARKDRRFERLSDSGKYKLVITPYATGKGYWDYTQGSIYDSDGRQIADVKRNYSSFPCSFIENHPNGHDYLVCGEDYQGQTVIELDTGKRVDYIPKSADQGRGFCWVGHHPSPSGDLLAVEGCVWACPFEVLIVDFSAPMDPPWPILLRDYDHEEFEGWIDNNSCKIAGHCVEYSKVHNKYKNDLTDDEWDELNKLEDDGKDYEELWGERYDDKIIWTRPSYFEVAEKFVTNSLKFLVDNKLPCSTDTFDEFGALADKLSEGEMKKLRERNPEIFEWFKKELRRAEMQVALK